MYEFGGAAATGDRVAGVKEQLRAVVDGLEEEGGSDSRREQGNRLDLMNQQGLTPRSNQITREITASPGAAAAGARRRWGSGGGHTAGVAAGGEPARLPPK